MQNFNNEWFKRLSNKEMEWVNKDSSLTVPNLAPTAPDVERWQWDGFLKNETGDLVRSDKKCLI